MDRDGWVCYNPFCVNPTMQSRIRNYPQRPVVVVVVVVVVVCVSDGGCRRTHSNVLGHCAHSLFAHHRSSPDGFCFFGPVLSRRENLLLLFPQIYKYKTSSITSLHAASTIHHMVKVVQLQSLSSVVHFVQKRKPCTHAPHLSLRRAHKSVPT